jgi:hypothetical protein
LPTLSSQGHKPRHNAKKTFAFFRKQRFVRGFCFLSQAFGSGEHELIPVGVDCVGNKNSKQSFSLKLNTVLFSHPERVGGHTAKPIVVKSVNNGHPNLSKRAFSIKRFLVFS